MFGLGCSDSSVRVRVSGFGCKSLAVGVRVTVCGCSGVRVRLFRFGCSGQGDRVISYLGRRHGIGTVPANAVFGAG